MNTKRQDRNCTIITETEKAYILVLHSNRETITVPKSQCEVIWRSPDKAPTGYDYAKIAIPYWILKNNKK